MAAPCNNSHFASRKLLESFYRGNEFDCIVAMSGGVDSSVSVALLLQQKLNLLGLTLQLVDFGSSSEGELDSGEGNESLSQDMQDARRVANHLGVGHCALDERETFSLNVVKPFARAFASGLTPNPCVWCNERIKFGLLFRVMDSLGITHLATGHYARIERGTDDSFRLLRGRDPFKDQTYFLYRLTQAQLERTIFPLGDLTKKEVRSVASELGLPTRAKRESQDICFVSDGSYQDVIRGNIDSLPPPGRILHIDGRELGRHEGIFHFTIGQRRGLGISSSDRLYVVRIDPISNEVIVGSSADLERVALVLKDVNWICGEPRLGESFTIEVRYRHEGVPGIVKEFSSDGKAFVELQKTVRGAASGQAAVMYDGEEVVGGGTIEEIR